MTRTTISQSDLAKRTQEVVDRVQQGEMAVVESSGKDLAILLDPTDFRLLHALAQCAIEDSQPGPQSDPDVKALQAYLADDISLGKAADLLGLSRFELQDRFLRLEVPLRLGPATLEEAQAEVAAALKLD